MLLRGIIFIVPIFILLPQLTGNNGLWLAIPISEFLTLTIIVLTYLFSHRNRETALG